MASINLNGTQYYYELHGSGKPVVLIAGYGCDHTYWTAMLTSLVQHYQVLLFDNRGVGQTHDDGSALTADLMADDTLRLIKALNLSKPHIVGHSMGGTIAQRLAVKYAEQIDKVVIINSSAKWSLVALQASQAALQLREHRVEPELILDTLMPWLVGEAYLQHPQWVKQYKAVFLHHPHPQTLQDQARQFAALCEFDNRADLHKIMSPTLVVASREDLIAPAAGCKLIADGIAGARFTCISGGHSSSVESYRELNPLLREFLG
jgi:pimeloyl-ACP methyl ester carboxylesterase